VHSRRTQPGQSLTECLLLIAGVVLFAMLGFGLLSAGIGAQSASVATALAGGSAQPEAVFGAAYEAADIRLATFDETSTGSGTSGAGSGSTPPPVGGAAGSQPGNPAAPGSSTPSDENATGDNSSIAFAQGLASGLIDTLYEELSALLNPIETAQALAELLRLLATDLIETVALLYDELVTQQLDTLINGTDYERGFVIGNQASPFKALSVLAKASGAAGLIGIVQRIEDVDGIPRINGRRPINYKYAGRTHPSGVRFNERGFPDFSPYARAEVDLDNLTGDYQTDAARANKAIGLKSTPEGYVWHHVEDGKTLQLIPTDIHNAARHTGGSAIIRGRNQAGGVSP